MTHTNKLIEEKSPYLLQHAHNPVQWYPWGLEAFEAARDQDKPIFLSIGYSTCHWCHVMEHECFEDDEVAELMNDAFISIKVDREERPDIDNVYMSACTMLTGNGGWPLTIIMTPEKNPFFATTYIPKKSRFGRPGMMDLIPRITSVWKEDRERVNQSAASIEQHLQQLLPTKGTKDLDAGILHEAYAQFKKTFDPVHGGFGRAPKFPTPHNLLFLLRYWHRTREISALDMVRTTLASMRNKGLWDHVGHGFHRYSTDEKWILPHFEKMLYDQALLTLAYVEGYQVTNNLLFASTAKETCEFVLREMEHGQGGFYSAFDADTEGEEGKFYTWTTKDLTNALGEDEAEFWKPLLHVEEEGNFKDEATGRKTGANILYFHSGHAEQKNSDKVGAEQLEQRWEQAREKLLTCREQRTKPHLDDKILTDWNGLMIAALSRAGRVLEKEEFIRSAQRAVDFILEHMTDAQGYLYHRHRLGETAVQGFADDYAALIWGLLELYTATMNVELLVWADRLQRFMNDLFWDPDNGGFYQTSSRQEALPLRPKDIIGGPYPAANAIAFNNLLTLSRLLDKPVYLELAHTMQKSFSETIQKHPSAFAHFLSGLNFALGPSFEVLILGEEGRNSTKSFLHALNTGYFPHIVILAKTSANEAVLDSLAPHTADLHSKLNKTRAYICSQGSCREPIEDIHVLIDSISTAMPPK